MAATEAHTQSQQMQVVTDSVGDLADRAEQLRDLLAAFEIDREPGTAPGTDAASETRPGADTTALHSGAAVEPP